MYAQGDTQITLKADAGDDQKVYEGDEVTLDGSGSTGNEITYQWTQIDGEMAGLSDPNAERPIFTAPDIDDDEESLIFQLRITDNTDLTKKDTCIIEVVKKIIPNANAGSDQTVYEGTTVTLDGSRSTGNEITYEWTQIDGEPVILSNPNEANATFTSPYIDEAEEESLIFQLTITDKDGLTDTDVCAIKIIKNPPHANAGPDKTINEEETVTLDGSDSTGNEITYQWRQTAGLSVTLSDLNSDTPSFTAPDIGDDEEKSLTFELTVTDKNSLEDTDTCVVKVKGQDTPTADAGPDKTVDEGNTVTLDGSGSVGDELTYKWRQTAGTSVSLSESDTDKPTFTAPYIDDEDDDESLTFELTVTNKNNLKDTDTCVIRVEKGTGWCFIKTAEW
ncbi:PKD domain-containing protein [Desulfonema magnum]|uniref:PKD domain-containing protein n=1 Tax=Desulfonema magnum TaxID=45655 RepID=A0A975GN84_9BACT|nr:PKD domain-containing protein [Desulfonema magnum]